MSTFPLLKSGAVSQYPTTVTQAQPVQVIRFVDGTDQRFLSQGSIRREWQIDLTQLDEAEIYALEQFFVEQQGIYSTFSFPDPISGTNVPNCRFATSQLVTGYLGPDLSSTALQIIETNG
jgi:hypothetical protein